jgi:hypothetical protein
VENRFSARISLIERLPRSAWVIRQTQEQSVTSEEATDSEKDRKTGKLLPSKPRGSRTWVTPRIRKRGFLITRQQPGKTVQCRDQNEA